MKRAFMIAILWSLVASASATTASLVGQRIPPIGGARLVVTSGTYMSTAAGQQGAIAIMHPAAFLYVLNQLGVGGDSHFGGNTFIDGGGGTTTTWYVADQMTVGTDAHIGGNLYIDGGGGTTKTWYVATLLRVGSDAHIDGNTYIDGGGGTTTTWYAANGLRVGADTHIDGNLYVDNSGGTSGTWYVATLLRVGSDAHIDGGAYIDDVGGTSKTWTVLGLDMTTPTEAAENSGAFSHLETTSHSVKVVLDRLNSEAGYKRFQLWSGDHLTNAGWEFLQDGDVGYVKFNRNSDGYDFISITASAGGVVLQRGPYNYVKADANGDVVAGLYDLSGADYFRVKDSSGRTQASINTSGVVTAVKLVLTTATVNQELQGIVGHIEVTTAALEILLDPEDNATWKFVNIRAGDHPDNPGWRIGMDGDVGQIDFKENATGNMLGRIIINTAGTAISGGVTSSWIKAESDGDVVATLGDNLGDTTFTVQNSGGTNQWWVNSLGIQNDVAHRGWAPQITTVAVATSIPLGTGYVTYVQAANAPVELPDLTLERTGRTCIVKATHALGCTVKTHDDTAIIDGAVNVDTLLQYESVVYQSDTTNWYRIAKYD